MYKGPISLRSVNSLLFLNNIHEDRAENIYQSMQLQRSVDSQFSIKENPCRSLKDVIINQALLES